MVDVSSLEYDFIAHAVSPRNYAQRLCDTKCRRLARPELASTWAASLPVYVFAVKSKKVMQVSLIHAAAVVMNFNSVLFRNYVNEHLWSDTRVNVLNAIDDVFPYDRSV